MHPRWSPIVSIAQIDDLVAKSHERAQVIFKHSTRCIISKMVLSQWEEDIQTIPENVDLIYLDLLQHRDVSNALSERFQVRHESPQVLFIRHGGCVYHASHEQIKATALLSEINGL
ncbi:MAG: bacillithiol system redox-active protein YtxJ [Flavobacteriales bacterium]